MRKGQHLGGRAKQAQPKTRRVEDDFFKLTGDTDEGDRDVETVDKSLPEVVGQRRVDTLQVLSESVKKTATAGGVVESDRGEEDSFEHLLVNPVGGSERSSVEDGVSKGSDEDSDDGDLVEMEEGKRESALEVEKERETRLESPSPAPFVLLKISRGLTRQ